MRPAWKYSLIPVVAGISTLFAVLPHRGGDATVRIVAASGGFAYDPGAAQVAVGERVAFVNDTKQTHTATCDGCPWSTGDIQPSETKLVVFREAARYTFACAYHPGVPGLRGTLVVGSPPAAGSPTPTLSPSPIPLPT